MKANISLKEQLLEFPGIPESSNFAVIHLAWQLHWSRVCSDK